MADGKSHLGTEQSPLDEQMMRRALQLARLGYGFVSPNPMVGAVVTNAAGCIVGEGFHRRWGGPHAEVNAIASVRDKAILPECTVYVTLEPCSHYGKTPPCAKLLIDSNVRRVVVGCPDPFKEVSGRGIAMLRSAGIEVTENVLRTECEALNRKFIYAHTHRRPYVMLKWAQTADGFIGLKKDGHNHPLQISAPVSSVFMHRVRAGFDAILAGTGTIISDNPSLTCRLWPCRRLRPVVLDYHGHIPTDSTLLANPETIVFTHEEPLDKMLERLYSEYSITSLLVEGGEQLLNSFLRENLYQELRVEVSPLTIGSGVPAPRIPEG
ncbi:MAG: bifunctional diaminohydroxyphosphoribosylaminopyrimidine deaminase/5-amino-6-(5-phosphoribosylamino)uracil reductase RibD [Muribaculaceae bacterium]|nr:bifunctional diaminohydroxyphosphoribosylaminopyrimidine deaminase/5-amino-6-(5-phosphoribosylamino)uracil reductase RibD [Muribaculaceae bacterium]